MNDKRASIDIGSNSILLLAGEFKDNHFKELLNESHVTGLGRDLDKNQTFLNIYIKSFVKADKKNNTINRYILIFLKKRSKQKPVFSCYNRIS